jgi:DNA-binding winged helix-turn-helix (wHTH) protein
VINIGSYVLDQEEMTLSLDGNSVKLEPKVLAVLTYFYQNENRYIPMAELHEKVWQDRCVSDAAVRRIIGKLRLLFNDDHKAPNYIQSLPKRGYKLICKTSYTENNSAEGLITESRITIANTPKKTADRSHQPTQDTNKEANSNIDWLAKTFSWGNKTLISLFIAILGLLFIGPLAYRITALIS